MWSEIDMARDMNSDRQMKAGVNYENNTYKPYKWNWKSLLTYEEVHQIEVNQRKELKWNEKSASFYIIMYFFTYNLKYESLPLGGSDLNFFI